MRSFHLIEQKRADSFSDWHDKASVRSKPRRCIWQEIEASLDPFPRQLAPILNHPFLATAPPEVIRDALQQHLFAYLSFTDRLEHEVVNRTVRCLATGSSGLRIPPSMRLQCYKVYCDEAYHSLCCADLIFQFQLHTGFAFENGSGHPAINFYYSQLANCEPEMRSWAELFFVIVSETLISNTLSVLSNYKNLMSCVRQVVRDHAHDEARHRALFAHLCPIAWDQVPARFRRQLGLLLPGYIRCFLAHDISAIKIFLMRNFSHNKTLEVLAESYPSSEANKSMAVEAKTTMNVLKQAGVLSDKRIVDCFRENGLLG
jgi:hypothetical protein